MVRREDQKSFQKSIKKSIQNLPKINQKIYQKSIKNQPQNRSKITLGGVLGASWGPLGAIVENGRLASGCWKPLGAVLGASWGPLGAWIAVLGRFGASWARLGPSKKRCQNRSKIRCLSRSIFDTILVDLGKENGGKVGPKIDEKSMKNRTSILTQFFYGFLIDFGPHSGRPDFKNH